MKLKNEGVELLHCWSLLDQESKKFLEGLGVIYPDVYFERITLIVMLNIGDQASVWI